MERLRKGFARVTLGFFAVTLLLPSIAAAASTVTLIKQTIPDDPNQTYNFTFDGEGFGGSTVFNTTLQDGDSVSETFPGSTSGSISETVPEGWQLSAIECVTSGEAGASSSSNNVSITSEGAGTVTCTFTNKKNATIEIRKETRGDTGSFDFDALLDGESDEVGGEGGFTLSTDEANPASTTFSVPVNAEGSTFTVSEDTYEQGEGWELASIECTLNGETVGSLGEGEVTVTGIEPGDALVCTFTNTFCDEDESEGVDEDGNCGLDFGDAPDGQEGNARYPTLYENNGARHLIEEGFHLGSHVDSEIDGQPTTFDDRVNEDDGDGVEFLNALVPGQTASIRVFTSLPDGECYCSYPDEGYLEAWLDFNQDNDWDDEGEHVIDNLALAAGTHELSFPVPETAVIGTTYARFRWSLVGGDEEEPGLDPDGFAPEGEVEDHEVTIVSSSSQSTSSSTGGQPAVSKDTNGSQRGSRSNEVVPVIESLAVSYGLGGSTPPAGFGGSEQAVLLICSAQRLLLGKYSDEIIHVAADYLSGVTGIPADILYDRLIEPDYCAAVSASLKTYQELVALPRPKPVEVASDGLPVSTNPTWNKCVRNTATLADIRANTDVYYHRLNAKAKISYKLVAKSCDAYKFTASNNWQHPDDPFLVIGITPSTVKGGAPIVNVSPGYAVVPFTEWVASAAQ